MNESTVLVVFVAALLTAIATGIGALPFLFVREISKRWMSLSHAMAGGLMLAACHSLIAEGIALGNLTTIVRLTCFDRPPCLNHL